MLHGSVGASGVPHASIACGWLALPKWGKAVGLARRPVHPVLALISLPERSLTKPRTRDVVLLADLGEPHIGDSKLAREPAHGRLPNAVVQLLARDRDPAIFAVLHGRRRAVGLSPTRRSRPSARHRSLIVALPFPDLPRTCVVLRKSR
jgi:hypothetical protein